MKSHYAVYDETYCPFAFAWFLIKDDALEFLELVQKADPTVNFVLRAEEDR